MEIQISTEYDDNLLSELSLEDLVRFTLQREKKPENTEVSISFVSNQTIADLNERYRNKTGPTDVLSFECDGVDVDMPETYESDTFVLGDVIIAPDVARLQAEQYGTSFQEEIYLLLVHGLLHLCGYDHLEDDEAEHMEILEAEILSSWNAREKQE